MLRIHTSSLRYGGPDRLDISRGHGQQGVILAPSWDLVKRYSSKYAGKPIQEVSWASYRDEYTTEMRESLRLNRDAWKALLAADELTLCCYCPKPQFCHRSVAAELLLTLAKYYRIPAQNLGERIQEAA